jgi:ferrochelatase
MASFSSAKTAVLLLAHGSPERPEEVPEFMRRITGGRAVPASVIEEVQHRYGLIGASPLNHWTSRQRALLEQELGLSVYVGMRNWSPLISDTLREMAAHEVKRAVVICMAPQNSRTSVGLYRQALQSDGNLPFAIDFIESWHDHPGLVEAFASELSAAQDQVLGETGKKAPILFTAHSVPERTILEGDPYADQCNTTATLVARKAGLRPEEWVFAFQSQGMSGGPWIGPTVEEKILALKGAGHVGFLIQPVGFLCDHVEVLYDIDIAFKQFAESHGMRLRRAKSLNGSPLLATALADLVRSRLNA